MPAQDDYQRFSDLADEFELEGEDRSKFVNQYMEKKGYKPVLSWADPEPEENQRDNGVLGFPGGKPREKRQAPSNNGRQNRPSGGGFQYGND